MWLISLTSRGMNSLFQNSVDLPSQDPKPIMCVSDEGGSHVMPLIKISSEKEMDADILFSPKVADPRWRIAFMGWNDYVMSVSRTSAVGDMLMLKNRPRIIQK